MKQKVNFIGFAMLTVAVTLCAQQGGRGGGGGPEIAPQEGRGGGPSFPNGPNMNVPVINDVPQIPFESNANFFKITPDMNFGEVLGVAVNSKGSIVVLNHPGTASSGPLYGNATTQLWEFDSSGKFVREIGKGVYGLGYAHGVRFDRYDNLWVVDKGTNSVMKFNPAGFVTMNLGRRPEGYDSFDFKRTPPAQKVAVDGAFDGPTDVAWDAADNIYVSDGYVDSRIAKMDKNLAKAIENEMFKFEHLFALDAQSMGALLREVESDALINALKGVGEEQREVFFRAMSSRAADGVRDEIAQRGRLKMADVLEAQKAMVTAARRLAAEGVIAFGSSGDDEYV